MVRTHQEAVRTIPVAAARLEVLVSLMRALAPALEEFLRNTALWVMPILRETTVTPLRPKIVTIAIINLVADLATSSRTISK